MPTRLDAVGRLGVNDGRSRDGGTLPSLWSTSLSSVIEAVAFQWEWPASPTTEATSEHLHDVHEPGWAPLSLAVAADTPWPSVHLPALPGGMESHDVAALSYLDSRDHPGTMEAIVAAAAAGRVRALELLGKVTEVALFTDRVEQVDSDLSPDQLRDELEQRLLKLVGDT